MPKKSYKKTGKISVVLPCHNESNNLSLLIPEIIKNIPQKYRYEIICVDDGSEDNTAEVIRLFTKKDKSIKAIFLYRNFGHQEALRVGISSSTGDAIIIMDSDFQHPPHLITKFISKWEKGFDLVQGQKNDDKSASLPMKFKRKIGYEIWNRISDGILIPRTSDFCLMSKEIAHYIRTFDERVLFLRGLVRTIARKPILISYSVGVRKFGHSSYNTKVFINMFFNGLISFSTKPLRLASFISIFIFLVLGIFLLGDIIRALLASERIIQGWVTVVFLILFVNAVLLLYLGILGEYIGVIFKEVKQRPRSMVSKTINIQ